MRSLLSTLLLTLAFVGVVHAQGVDVHGFISQGYMDSSSNFYLTNSEPGSFEFSEFGLNVSAQIRYDLRVGLQLMARDLGSTGKGRPPKRFDDEAGLMRWVAQTPGAIGVVSTDLKPKGVRVLP